MFSYFYGLAIAIANQIVSENICSTELHCYSMGRELVKLIIIIHNMCHHLVTMQPFRIKQLQLYILARASYSQACSCHSYIASNLAIAGICRCMATSQLTCVVCINYYQLDFLHVLCIALFISQLIIFHLSVQTFWNLAICSHIQLNSQCILRAITQVLQLTLLWRNSVKMQLGHKIHFCTINNYVAIQLPNAQLTRQLASQLVTQLYCQYQRVCQLNTYSQLAILHSLIPAKVQLHY